MTPWIWLQLPSTKPSALAYCEFDLCVSCTLDALPVVQPTHNCSGSLKYPEEQSWIHCSIWVLYFFGGSGLGGGGSFKPEFLAAVKNDCARLRARAAASS